MSAFQVGRILDSYWNSFQQIIPKEAGAVQREEMKKAFFAGCSAVMSVNAAIGEDDISEDQGMLVLQSMHMEIQAFARSLKDNGQGGPTPEIWTPQTKGN